MTKRARHEGDEDRELDVLFATLPDRFVAVRNELAAKAKASGRGDLAIRIQSMKRPSPVVWLANALAREYPKEVAAVLAAGEGFRSAYSSGDVDTVRGATRDRHRAVSDALRRAHEILKRAGRGDAAARPLAGTLIGASLDPAQGKLLGEGRLQHEIEPPQLEGLLGEAPVLRKQKRQPEPEAPVPARDRRAAEREEKKRTRDRQKELRSREQAVAAATRDAERAAKVASDKLALATAARQAADHAEEQAREAQKLADKRRIELETFQRDRT